MSMTVAQLCEISFSLGREEFKATVTRMKEPCTTLEQANELHRELTKSLASMNEVRARGVTCLLWRTTAKLNERYAGRRCASLLARGVLGERARGARVR